jgi:hypothetical protein
MQMYEHPQNVLLLRLINANLDLLAVHKETAVEGQRAGAPPGGCRRCSCAATPALPCFGSWFLWLNECLELNMLPCPARCLPAAEEAAQAQLGKSLRLWLDLQNSLNALVDSNAGGWAARAGSCCS